MILGMFISVIFSYMHVWEEEDGGLVTAFGVIVNRRIPTLLGFILFVVVLLVELSFVSGLAYCDNPWRGYAAGFLIGARLGDCVFSHWGPTMLGYDVPGNNTTFFYVFESLVLLVLPPFSWWFVLLGALQFAIVLPSLWLIGTVCQWPKYQERI